MIIASLGFSPLLERCVLSIQLPVEIPIKVFKASQIIAQDESLDHEYLPITGLAEFTSGAAKLILGADSPAFKEGRVVSVQTISGTGANHLGALFLSRFYYHGQKPEIYVSNPTWGEFTGRRLVGSY